MQNFIVHGHYNQGVKFRPSDWAERLVNAGTTNQYSRQCVHVFTMNGIKGISVKHCLEETDSALLAHILDFANTNNLTINYIGKNDDTSH